MHTFCFLVNNINGHRVNLNLDTTVLNNFLPFEGDILVLAHLNFIYLIWITFICVCGDAALFCKSPACVD